MHEKLQLNP